METQTVVVNVILHRRQAADGAAAYCSGGFVHHDLDQYTLLSKRATTGFGQGSIHRGTR